MVVFRRNQNNYNRGNSFAKGPRAIAIDQRTGFKHLQSQMVFEPGTNYYVHRDESDGPFNLVTDQLNYVSDKMKKPDAQALRYSSPEYDIPTVLVSNVTAGAVVSADALALGAIPPGANFIQYYPTSITTD
jgi:hypothetical protein